MIGHYLLTDLTADIIQIELMNELKNSGLSYSSVHKAYTTIKSALNYAVSKHLIPINPCFQVNDFPSSVFNIESVHEDIRFLNEEEIAVFKKQALAENKNQEPKYMYGKLILLVLYIGCRVGELSAIKWRDVDLTNKTIRIAKNITSAYDYDRKNGTKKRKTIEQNTTKSKNGFRYVPLNASACALLNGLYNEETCFPNNYIISNSQKMVNIDVISNSYSNIATAAVF